MLVGVMLGMLLAGLVSWGVTYAVCGLFTKLRDIEVSQNELRQNLGIFSQVLSQALRSSNKQASPQSQEEEKSLLSEPVGGFSQ